MSQLKISVRPPPHVSFVQHYPGIPKGSGRENAFLEGTVEVTTGAKGVKASFLKVELRKTETVHGTENYYDLIGSGPTMLWTAESAPTADKKEEEGELWARLKTKPFHFTIPIPERIPPSLEVWPKRDGLGVAYHLLVTLQQKPTKNIFGNRKKMEPTEVFQDVQINMANTHPGWALYSGKPEVKESKIPGLTMKISRESTCYGPGDKISVDVTLTNETSKVHKLKKIEMSLRETLTIFETEPSRAPSSSSRQSHEAVFEVKVSPRKQLYINDPLKTTIKGAIPANRHRITISSAKFFRVAYTLKVVASVDGFSDITIDHLPTLVSHWPRDKTLKNVEPLDLAQIGPVPGLSEVSKEKDNQPPPPPPSVPSQPVSQPQTPSPPPIIVPPIPVVGSDPVFNGSMPDFPPSMGGPNGAESNNMNKQYSLGGGGGSVNMNQHYRQSFAGIGAGQGSPFALPSLSIPPQNSESRYFVPSAQQMPSTMFPNQPMQTGLGMGVPGHRTTNSDPSMLGSRRSVSAPHSPSPVTPEGNGHGIMGPPPSSSSPSIQQMGKQAQSQNQNPGQNQSQTQTQLGTPSPPSRSSTIRQPSVKLKLDAAKARIAERNNRAASGSNGGAGAQSGSAAGGGGGSYEPAEVEKRRLYNAQVREVADNTREMAQMEQAQRELERRIHEQRAQRATSMIVSSSAGPADAAFNQRQSMYLSAAEEKSRIYDAAKAQAEAYQSSFNQQGSGSSGPSTSPAHPQRGTSEMYSSAEEEKARLHAEAVARAQTFQSQLSHQNSVSGPSTSYASSSHIMAPDASRSNGNDSYPSYPTAEEEKSRLYNEARQALERQDTLRQPQGGAAMSFTSSPTLRGTDSGSAVVKHASDNVTLASAGGENTPYSSPQMGAFFDSNQLSFAQSASPVNEAARAAGLPSRQPSLVHAVAPISEEKRRYLEAIKAVQSRVGPMPLGAEAARFESAAQEKERLRRQQDAGEGSSSSARPSQEPLPEYGRHSEENVRTNDRRPELSAFDEKAELERYESAKKEVAMRAAALGLFSAHSGSVAENDDIIDDNTPTPPESVDPRYESRRFVAGAGNLSPAPESPIPTPFMTPMSSFSRQLPDNATLNSVSFSSLAEGQKGPSRTGSESGSDVTSLHRDPAIRLGKQPARDGAMSPPLPPKPPESYILAPTAPIRVLSPPPISPLAGQVLAANRPASTYAPTSIVSSFLPGNGIAVARTPSPGHYYQPFGLANPAPPLAHPQPRHPLTQVQQAQ